MSTKPDAEQVLFKSTQASTVEVPSERKLQDFLSVTDFGAIEGGVVESGAAFTAAEASGRGYVVPPGVYKLAGVNVTYRGNVFGNDLAIPVGTTAQRPVAGLGKIRYNTNLSAFEGYTASGWAPFGGSTPVGSIIDYAADTPPTGWLVCDGSVISRATYSALFLVIGTRFGNGDGSTTFNLPDLKGRYRSGWDSGSERAFGSYQASANKAHTHSGSTASAGSHSHTGTRFQARVSIDNTAFFGVGGGEGISGTYSTNAAGAHSHSLAMDSQGEAAARPDNLALLTIIKV